MLIGTGARRGQPGHAVRTSCGETAGTSIIPARLCPRTHRRGLVVHSAHALFLRRRFRSKSPLPLERTAVVTSGSRPVSPALPQFLCLRLAHQLCADNAEALAEVVSARMPAAISPPCSVVLDLSATLAFDDDAETALQLLHHLLADRLVRLRLVLPEARARTAFLGCAAGQAIGPDSVHTSVRAAMLATFASLPGAALITSAQRELLAVQPEPLVVPARSAS